MLQCHPQEHVEPKNNPPSGLFCLVALEATWKLQSHPWEQAELDSQTYGYRVIELYTSKNNAFGLAAFFVHTVCPRLSGMLA